jgi:hypothetical protein
MPVTDTKRLTLRFTPDMVRIADGLIGLHGRRTRQSVISAAVWIGLQVLTDQSKTIPAVTASKPARKTARA